MNFTQKITLILGVLAFLVYYKYFKKEGRNLSFLCLLVITSMMLSKLTWEIMGRTIRFDQVVSICLFIQFLILWRTIRSIYLNKYSYLILLTLPFLFFSSLTVAPAASFSVMKSLLYLPYFAGYIAVTNELRTEKTVIKAWDFFYKFSAVVITLSVVSFFIYQGGINLGTVRNSAGSLWLNGPVIVANIFGSTSVIIFTIAFLKMLYATEQKKLFNTVALIGSAAGIVLSLTRAAWLGACFTILLIIIFSFYVKKARATIKPLLLIIGSVVFVLISTRYISPLLTRSVHFESSLEGQQRGKRDTAPSDNINFGMKSSDVFKEAKQGGWRREVYELALKEWLANPILGNGTDSLIYKYKNIRKYIASTFIAFLHDWGIIALSLHLLFYLFVFIGLVKIVFSRKMTGLYFVAVSQLIILIVSTLMYQVSTPMWLSIYWILLAFYSSTVSVKPENRIDSNVKLNVGY
ncbi:O-antigen ligase family protein [Acidobacteriota bacterium]